MAWEVDYPRAVLAGLVVLVVLALGVAAGTSTVSFGAYNAAWDGASDLQGLAADQGAEAEIVTNASVYEDVEPNRTVALVLSPSSVYDRADRERIRAFVEAGGTLVVAEDFRPHSNALLAAVGAEARLDGRLLRDERHNYRSPAMPVATNVTEEAEATTTNRSVTDGVEQLTLNYGTAVEPGNASVLVRTSPYAYRDVDRDGELDENETLGTYPVVTAESVGAGRVLVVGDPSAFVNVMLDRPGNNRFVANTFAAASVGPGSADTVILDYSHAGAIPPLMFAVLTLRDSVLLQLLVGFGGLAALAVGARWPGTLAGLARKWKPAARQVGSPGGRGAGVRDGAGVDDGDEDGAGVDDGTLDGASVHDRGVDDPGVNLDLDGQGIGAIERAESREAVESTIRALHPEWDDERVRRLGRAIITQRDELRNDD
jgi:hypothetical protein